MNQARSIRRNLSASGAHPNPQGSFRYGEIKVTQSYLLENKLPMIINGKLRTALNGISYLNPNTPLRLADQYKLKGIYKLDFPTRPFGRAPQVDTSVINGSYRGFVEVVFQNNDTQMQSYHMDGYAFFVVAMEYGMWTESSRGRYNKWDAVSRSTIQVYPEAWTAVYVSLDNVGMWNIRAENLDAWYRGQETYIKIVDPESSFKTELPMPSNVLYCGALAKMQPYVLADSPVPSYLSLQIFSLLCSRLVYNLYFQVNEFLFIASGQMGSNVGFLDLAFYCHFLEMSAWLLK